MKKIKFLSLLFSFSLLICSYKPIAKSVVEEDVPVFFNEISSGVYTENPDEIREMKQLVFDELSDDELEQYVNRESDDWFFVPTIIDVEICPGSGYSCRLAELMANYNPIFEGVRKGRKAKDFVLIFSNGAVQ